MYKPDFVPAKNLLVKEPLAHFFSLAAITAGLEFMIWTIFGITEDIILVLSLHLLVISALGYYLYRLPQLMKARFSLLLLIATAATGPFGPCICLCAALIYHFYPRHGSLVYEWIDNFLHKNRTDSSEWIQERLSYGLDNHSKSQFIEPFGHVLASGTIIQKQKAIAKITRYFCPQFTPLLLQAVQDPCPAVRVQAATALAKIERDFTGKFVSFEHSLRFTSLNDPERLPLAHLYDEYAYTGLADEHTQQLMREKAITIYEAYLRSQDDHEIRMRLARLYLRQNQPEAAYELMHNDIELHKITSISSVFWYMESLLRLNKVMHVRDIAQRYANYPEAAEILRIWNQRQAYGQPA